LSDWDYEITVSVTCEQIPGQWPTIPDPRWTWLPLNDAKVKDWFGRFANGSISCNIGPSKSVLGPLWIDFTDESGQRYDIRNATTSNQSVLLRNSLTTKQITLEPFDKPMRSALVKSNAIARVTGLRSIAPQQDSLQAKPVLERADEVMRIRIGGDRVALPNGGILELCETLADDVPTGGRVLRYVRPATIDSILQISPHFIDVYLQPVPTL
jgi:hypothetical protein